MHFIQIGDREFLNLTHVAKVHFKGDDKHAEVTLATGEKLKFAGKDEIAKLKGRLQREAKAADGAKSKAKVD